MTKRSQKDAVRAYNEYLRKRKETHKIQVKDLRVVKAVVPDEHPAVRALEKAPDYSCTCGEFFDDKAEADQHVKNVNARSSVG